MKHILFVVIIFLSYIYSSIAQDSSFDIDVSKEIHTKDTLPKPTAQWHFEKYYGNVKSVEFSWVNVKDTSCQTYQNSKTQLFFDKKNRIQKEFYLSPQGDTLTITYPIYNDYGKVIVENSINQKGGLNDLVLNKYLTDTLSSSTYFTSSGQISSTIDVQYLGDTILLKEIYFNTLTLTFDEQTKRITTIIQGKDGHNKSFVVQQDSLVADSHDYFVKYDKYGNWIEKHIEVNYLWDNGYEHHRIINRRKILYYP